MNQSLKSNSVHFERALQILKEAYEEEDYRINEVVDVWKIMTKK
jgi:chromosome segregation and condensation protein ScpB